MKSIIQLISILALTVKTKLLINEYEKVFESNFINPINQICLECYKIQSLLSETNDPTSTERFNKGITSPCKYSDYKTGFEKNISPGLNKGQLMGASTSTINQQKQYMTMVSNARQSLEHQYQAKSETGTIVYSSSPEFLALANTMLKTINKPKTLKQLAANVLIKNRNKFFKNLSLIPGDIKNEYPELEINYKDKYIKQVAHLINGITFKPSDEEKNFLNCINEALQSSNPYNNTHAIIKEMDEKIKKGYLSIFKTNMQPIRNQIVAFMKQYNTNKDEYVSLITFLDVQPRHFDHIN